MAAHKYFDRICVVITVLAVILTVLFMNGESFGLEKIIDEDTEEYSGSSLFTKNDLDGGWDSSAATVITLDGENAAVQGGGAYFYDGNVMITSAGTFVVSGNLEEGSIIVDANDQSKVWILLKGVSISCSDDACIQVDEADKVFLTLAEGTENTLTSGSEYSEEALADGTDGVIFAHDDLTINGSGSLTVSGGNQHGIAANDDLVITGGNISIEASGDGIHVNEAFRLTEASVTVSAGDDGIHSDKSVLIAGGTLVIPECYEGIEAQTVEITGGDITVYPSDDGINAGGGSSDLGGFGGQWMQGMADTAAAKEQAAGTDAAPAEEQTGETETAAAEERTGETDSAAAEDETEETVTPEVVISGGKVTIINEKGSDADGIDSNGNIIISGGEILVSLVGNGSNNALDYGSENGGTCVINGGRVVAAGGSSMLEEISSGSAQPSVTWMLSDTAEAGTVISVKDSEGNTVLTQEIPCSFTAVTVSDPALTLGETYTLEAGENSEEVTLEQTAASAGNAAGGFGGMGGGMPGQMGQHQGGPRGFAQTDDSSASEEDGEMPEAPQMSEDGEMPEAPQMSEDGEMPEAPQMSEDGEMPEAPQMSGNGEMPEAPQMGENGEMRGNQMRGGGPGGMQGMGQENQQESQNASAAEESSGSRALSDYGSDTWIPLGVSAVALLAGILIAWKFRKRGI